MQALNCYYNVKIHILTIGYLDQCLNYFLKNVNNSAYLVILEIKLGLFTIKNIKKYIRAIKLYMDRFMDWIWQDESTIEFDLSKPLKFIRQIARWGLIMFHGIFENKILVHASALTYTTMLSILPIIAVALGVIQWSGIWKVEQLRELVTTYLPEFNFISKQVFDYLEGTNFSSLGFAGIFFLLTAVFSMMGKVEQAMNEIWDVQKSRPVWRKVTDYFAIILFSSTMITLSWGFMIVSGDWLTDYLPTLGDLLNQQIFTKFATLLFLGSAFTIIIKLMPRTKVPLKSAAIGGFVSGFLYMLVSSTFFGLQIGMANYNLIYSSLAALPITIIWIDISWIILLVSAELAFTLAHGGTFNRQALASVLSPAYLESSIARIAVEITRKTLQSDEGELIRIPTLELSKLLKIPIKIVNDLAGILVENKVLAGNSRRGVWIKKDVVKQTTIADVIFTLRLMKGEESNSIGNKHAVDDYMAELHKVMQNVENNITLYDAAMK